jgi:hypothetical protein
LAVIRVRGKGAATGEEHIVCGGAWQPARHALEIATRTPGYSALEVGAAAAERLARRWAYTYHRIVEPESERTVAFVRVCAMPVTHEQSTCRSGVWENTRRLKRIERGLDDYRVVPVDVAAVEECLHDLPAPAYRYFAAVSDTDAGPANPSEVLRVRTKDGVRERLGAAMAWEPSDATDGAAGLRDHTLLEIDEEAVSAAVRGRSSLDRA